MKPGLRSGRAKLFAASMAVLCLAGCPRRVTRHYTSPAEAHCASQAGVPPGSDLEHASLEKFSIYLRCMLASGALDREMPAATPLLPELERGLRDFCRGAGLPDDCADSQDETPQP